MGSEYGHEISGGCLECGQLKEAFRKATLALEAHHDDGDSCAGSPRIKDIAYIHKEAELYEANNRARRAWNEHREKVHEGASQWLVTSG